MAVFKYKLLTQYLTSLGATQWKLGEWQEAKGGSDKPLCSDDWLHCYDSPEVAAIFNCMHARVPYPRLFVAECKGNTLDDNGTKRGYKKMRIVEEVPFPVFYQRHHIRFAIYCAQSLNDAQSESNIWSVWADKWLRNIDRDWNNAAYELRHRYLTKPMTPRLELLVRAIEIASCNNVLYRNSELMAAEVGIQAAKIISEDLKTHITIADLAKRAYEDEQCYKILRGKVIRCEDELSY